MANLGTFSSSSGISDSEGKLSVTASNNSPEPDPEIDERK